MTLSPHAPRTRRHGYTRITILLLLLLAVTLGTAIVFTAATAKAQTSSACPGLPGGPGRSGDCYAIETGLDCTGAEPTPWVLRQLIAPRLTVTTSPVPSLTTTVCSGSAVTVPALANVTIEHKYSIETCNTCQEGKIVILVQGTITPLTTYHSGWRSAGSNDTPGNWPATFTATTNLEAVGQLVENGTVLTSVILATASITIAGVDDVVQQGTEETSAIVPVGTSVSLEARASPTGADLGCLEWRSRKQNSDGSWPGTWASATAVASPDAPGMYQWHARNGQQDDGAPFTLASVEVGKLTCVGVDSTADNPRRVVVPVNYNNGSIAIVATLTAGGIPYGKPHWTGTSTSSGLSATLSTALPGVYQISAECGNTITLTVIVLKAELLVRYDFSNNEAARSAKMPNFCIYFALNQPMSYFYVDVTPKIPDIADFQIGVTSNLPSGVQLGSLDTYPWFEWDPAIERYRGPRYRSKIEQATDKCSDSLVLKPQTVTFSLKIGDIFFDEAAITVVSGFDYLTSVQNQSLAISLTRVKYNILADATYDENLGESGFTSLLGDITVGPIALTSENFLASTLIHEGVHLQQGALMRDAMSISNGLYVSGIRSSLVCPWPNGEIWAHSVELEQAAWTCLSDQERGIVQDNIDNYELVRQECGCD